MYKHLTQYELYYIYQSLGYKFGKTFTAGVSLTVEQAAIKFIGRKNGSKNCLLTLVDKASKFTLIRKLANKTAHAATYATYDCYDNSMLPFLTITYDNGAEFSNHEAISRNLGCDIYFARSYHSCDKGLNEHTNV